MTKTMIIHTDGAARGNPGRSAAAAIVDERDGNLTKVAKLLPDGTNNVAEYQALILGLKTALDLGATDIIAYSDSELMVKQLNGEYRTKDPKIVELRTAVMAKVDKLDSFDLRHINRERNHSADALANRALDGYIGNIYERMQK